jgi:hypothetical protein
MSSRRLLTAALCSACALAWSPLMAADWWPYQNPRFGYSIELPPEFGLSSPTDHLDGLTLAPADQSAKLMVFASHRFRNDFGSEARIRLVAAKQDGWQVSFSKMSAQTFSYTGMRGNRIVYGRGVALCGGGAAFFQMDYAKADMQRYDAVLMRLARRLHPTEKCGAGGVGKPLFKGSMATG